MHCFRSRFIVNQKFVFTFLLSFSLPFPGYCGLALNAGPYFPLGPALERRNAQE